MSEKQVAVFNTNPEGALVVRLVEAGTYHTSYTTRQMVPTEKEEIIRKVQDSLPSGHVVCGISNLLPSDSGLGGAYVFPVRVKPIKRYEVDIGPSSRNLADLVTANTY